MSEPASQTNVARARAAFHRILEDSSNALDWIEEDREGHPSPCPYPYESEAQKEIVIRFVDNFCRILQHNARATKITVRNMNITGTSATDFFLVESGRIRITDPCYKPDVLNAGWVLAKNGIWAAHVGYNGASVAYFHIRHDDERQTFDPSQPLTWGRTGFRVGVDSGQVAFFDHDWYLAMCGTAGFYRDVTKTCVIGVGLCVSEFGAASLTMWGDGIHACHIRRDETGSVVEAVFAMG
jgi:hypothetical protein